jgi:pimeloyl-ACP methyl ester carboxylesterase
VRINVADQEIELESRGPEHGPTLVFLHGLTTDRRIMLEAFEPAFAAREGWRRLYVDLPGHGASSANLAGASADALVACLARLLRDHAGPQPALVSHSYGGYLSLGVLAQVPELLGLFLANPIIQPDLGLRKVPPQRHVVLEEGLEFLDDEERQTFLGEAAVQSGAVLDAFRRVVAPAHRATQRPFLSMVRSRYAMSPPWSAALRAFERPVHVVCGQDDYWTGYTDALDLVRLARRCGFSVVPGCGHLLPIEAGDALRGLFRGWLDEVERELSRR